MSLLLLKELIIIFLLDNSNAPLILISENQILKLSSAVVQPPLCWAKTVFECAMALHIFRWKVITCKAFWRVGFLVRALPFPLSSLIFDVKSLRAL